MYRTQNSVKATYIPTLSTQHNPFVSLLTHSGKKGGQTVPIHQFLRQICIGSETLGPQH